MPITSVIKNPSAGTVMCFKVPEEDFNVGSQLIVAEYEEALFMKDGIIEECFGPGKYTLTTENFPFLTKLISRFLTGGVSQYSCKIYFISKQHHLEQKWGTIEPIKVLDPYWETYFKIQARGAYTTVIKNGKQFFLKMVGANQLASENDIKKNFRTAFVQNISEELADYISNAEEETIVVCNKKKALANELKSTLNDILDEYGMELINFYVETIGIVEDESYLSVVKMRRERQEREFDRAQRRKDTQLDLSLNKERAETERYVSGQSAQADFERMKIRNQEDPNGWAKQEIAGVLNKAADNDGMGGAFVSAGVGLNVGKAMGEMMREMGTPAAPSDNAGSNSVICPKCNAAVAKGMKFCGSCGNPMEKPKIICSNCGFEIPAGMKFCGECGTPVKQGPRKCSKCGAEVADGMKFCGECGNRME